MTIQNIKNSVRKPRGQQCWPPKHKLLTRKPS